MRLVRSTSTPSSIARFSPCSMMSISRVKNSGSAMNGIATSATSTSGQPRPGEAAHEPVDDLRHVLVGLDHQHGDDGAGAGTRWSRRRAAARRCRCGPRRRAAIHTMTSVPRPPTMASTVIHGRSAKCRTMPMVAPSAAPDDTPVTYGSVSGLRNRSCRITPATASAAPTSAGGEHARHADLPEDRVVEVALDRPRRHQCHSWLERQRDRPQGERQHEADGEDAGGQDDPRPLACAGELRSLRRDASGWIIPASAVQALGQARARAGDEVCPRSRTRARP